MLITFKSKAAADVLMYKEHAKPMLDLLHKDIKQGIITAAESAAAVATLEAEIAGNKAQHPLEKDAAAKHAAADDDHEDEKIQFVSFATRAYPLLEMLRAADLAKSDIVWGV